MAAQNLSPLAIATAEGFGTSALSRSIGPTAIASAEAFGKPTMVSAVVAGGSVYRFYINDVLVNDYILRRKKPVTIAHEAGSFGSCRMTWYDPTGTLRPLLDQEVVIVDTSENNTRIFGGLVTRTSEQFHSGTTAMEIDITAATWGAYLERRVAHKVYTTYQGDLISILLPKIASDFLSGTGITVRLHGSVSAELGVFEAYCQKVSEAFRRIMQAADADYWVDPYKVAHVFNSGTGWESSPFGFADDDGNFMAMRVERNQALRANKVYVKNSRPMRSNWVDTWVGNDPEAGGTGTQFPTSYFLDAKPIIRVNDVDQIVTELGDWSIPGWQWYYIPNGTGVFQNWAGTPLGGGDTIEIIYPSPLQYVYIAKDQDSIDTDGLWESIVEGKDIPGYEEMAVIGEAELLRRKVNPVDVEVLTRRSGLFPGQLISINCTQPALVDDLLVKSVNGSMVDGKYMLWTVRASNSELQKPDTWKKYVADLVQRDRQPVPRGRYSIHVELAGDIPGLTNPGLVAQVVPGARTIERSGYIREWLMGWEDGPPFDEDIFFDILIDGVSIFPETLPKYPAATTGIVSGYTFATENIVATYKGKVTAEITYPPTLPTAKNGWIDLVIEG